MKKVLLVIGIIIAVLAGALLMRKVIFPFICWILSGIFGGMSISFAGIVDFIKSLF